MYNNNNGLSWLSTPDTWGGGLRQVLGSPRAGEYGSYSIGRPSRELPGMAVIILSQTWTFLPAKSLICCWNGYALSQWSMWRGCAHINDPEAAFRKACARLNECYASPEVLEGAVYRKLDVSLKSPTRVTSSSESSETSWWSSSLLRKLDTCQA